MCLPSNDATQRSAYSLPRNHDPSSTRRLAASTSTIWRTVRVGSRAHVIGREMTKASTTMKRNVASNIPRYFVYTALKGFSFGLFLAVWVIYLQQQRGLSLSQAALIDVTFFVAAALAEIPTGIVADKYGRKPSLIAGAALLSVGVWGWTF